MIGFNLLIEVDCSQSVMKCTIFFYRTGGVHVSNAVK